VLIDAQRRHIAGLFLIVCRARGMPCPWVRVVRRVQAILKRSVGDYYGSLLAERIDPDYATLGTSDINYYSVSTAGTVGGKYPLLSIDGADGN
jgi:hypothetical protein